tara:strand:+ start:2188 stop:2988 length:801 start_codon:yes stop_codon:yes gene_type:complete
MADYKPTFFDQLINLLPSLIAPTLQYKVAKDGQKAQMDRLNVQLQAQKDLAKQSQDFQIEQKEIDRDLTSFREANRTNMDLLKMQQQAEQQFVRDTMAYDTMQEQMRSNAVKEGLAKEELALAVRKQDESLTKKDLLDYEERQRDKKVTDIPLLGQFTQERNILNQADDFAVDEQLMINQWNTEGFQQKLAGEVGRFQKAKEGTAGYQDKIDLIERLIELRSAFDQPAFTEDKQWYDVFGKAGTSSQSKEGRRIVSQIDGLLSRLQ